MAKARAKSGLKRAPAKRRPRKAKPGTRGLAPAETRLERLSGEAQEVASRIESVGGQLLGAYNDPLGKHPVLVAILPIESVEPTPFQRDLSQAHHRKLADVLDRTGMFLDPDHRGHRAGEGLLDAERHAPADGDAAPRRARHHRARGPASARSPGRSSPSTPRRRTTCARKRSR